MTLRSWLLLANLLALQIVDILTTNRALAGNSGVIEANPVVASFQAHYGDLWWVPKMIAVAFVFIMAKHVRQMPIGLSLSVGVMYFVVVLNNLLGMV